MVCCAITQAHWLLTVEAQVQFQGTPCGICGEQSENGTDFPYCNPAFLSIVLPLLLHISNHSSTINAIQSRY